MKNKLLGPFEWFIILGTLICSAIFAWYGWHYKGESIDWLGNIAAMINIFCVVLSARASRWNFLFGVAYAVLYAYICFVTNHFGNAVVYAALFFPMNIIGYFSWKKIGDIGESGQVAARRMTTRQRIFVTIAGVLVAAGAWLILKKVGGQEALTDSMLTVLCVMGQVLLTLAFAEQWFIWILVNIVAVVMWGTAAIKGTPHSVAMVIGWFFTLVNSINGYIVWQRLSKPAETK